MKKILVVLFLTISLMSLAQFRFATVNAEKGITQSSDTDAEWFDVSDFRDATYYRVLSNWEKTYSRIQMTEISVSPEQFILLNSELSYFDLESYPDSMVVLLEENDTFTVNVNVSVAGLYHIGFDFMMEDTYYTIPSIEVLVNGESQFNEMSDLELDVIWKSISLEENVRYNRYGNELLPNSEAVLEWDKYFFDDYNSYFEDPYLFLLEEGENEISITALNLGFYVGKIYVKSASQIQSYQEYQSLYSGMDSFEEPLMLTLQGEDYSTKNELEIKASYYKESAMTPYTYKNTVLNQLDGSSVSRGGSYVTYDFEVEQSGFYQIALKVLHNSNLGVASGKNIYIDGEIPFEELSEYLFDSSRKWENVVLSDQSQSPFQIYLSEGHHTLTIETSSSQYMSQIDQLNSIMDSINSISLLVQTITGGNSDDALDWNILKYIPDLVEQLNTFADTLERIYSELNELDGGLSSSPEISTLNVAAKQLRRLTVSPNKIGSKLAEFSEGSGSAYQLIGNSVSSLLQNPLSIDCIYFYQDMELPKPTGSFFRKLWDGIKGFFYSFFDTRYNDYDVDEDTLEVWVGQSSLYLDIIQSMIDQQFTDETGIKVKCSILSNVSRIVLSNATGDNPDVVLSIDDWNPYAYALRGMLEDLSLLEGFDEITSHYYPNNFTPMIFEDGVYGIPETQSVFLLYYRKDILNYLGLEVPDTWDDVLGMLPILQSYQMNFYHPLGSDSAYKGYGFTAPIIYQLGGEIFTENGISSTLNDPTTVAAIKYMTDLFTIYNLPLQVSSFFEHFRSGDMPIGISTIEMYLQLKYAAPELSGQWDVAVIPGMLNEETQEVERWSTTYGKASILFANSDKTEEGWELIQWWNSTQTQIEFMQRVKTGLGEKFLILSANMDALNESVWNQDIKRQIVEQASWARIPAVTPGSYIVERELSNIWNKIVIDLDNVSVAINESIPRISRELSRKFDEFGYYSVNNPFGIPYVVPMSSNIDRWIKEGYDDEAH